MPNRILRDGILRSERVAALSPMAELFYRRLMSVVDDYGRYYAKIPLLLSDCFPIRPQWADEESLSLWVAECQTQDLISIYEVNGTSFLELRNFCQRIRSQRESKFPPLADAGGQRRTGAASRARSPSPTNCNSNIDSSEEKKSEMRPEFDDQWQDFRKQYSETGKPLIEDDFSDAHYTWKVLDFFQRLAAIKGIRDRIEAGQWDDPNFIPAPKKYLQREYTRAVIPRRRQETAIERAIREA